MRSLRAHVSIASKLAKCIRDEGSHYTATMDCRVPLTRVLESQISCKHVCSYIVLLYWFWNVQRVSSNVPVVCSRHIYTCTFTLTSFKCVSMHRNLSLDVVGFSYHVQGVRIFVYFISSYMSFFKFYLKVFFDF